MITVYQILTSYCKENKMKPPNHSDFTTVGSLVSGYFKKEYVPANYKPETEIPGTGFIYTRQGNNTFCVSGYPENFRDEMIRIIEQYYADKKIEKVLPTAEPTVEKTVSVDPVKKRKRIPTKPKLEKVEYKDLPNRE